MDLSAGFGLLLSPLSLLFLSSVPCLTLDIFSPYRSDSIGGKEKQKRHQDNNEKQLFRQPVMLRATKEKVLIASAQ